ncbi:polymorphic toxin type 15 domain-containing protein [Agrococcus sp. SL85]|nr:polymorphic toxin type 15 domain-containing protein [Agrococcus sp. SL85]WAC67437.1 polymorphic toxin type 15 domain-containing protein [Agrococcus sp. SL85]
MNLPGELVWVLDMLGYEWPPLDEDEMRRAANIIRTFKDDIEGTIEQATARIKDDAGGAMQAQAATSFGNAWDTNRQQNVEQLVDVLDPAATGIDIAADAVLALTVKVIAELVITAAQIAAAAASAVLTLGASLAANAAIIALRKKLLDVATNIASDLDALQDVLPRIARGVAGQSKRSKDTIKEMAEAIRRKDAELARGVRRQDVDVRAFNNRRYDQAEFDRQVDEQVDALQQMSVADWIRNRGDSLDRGRTSASTQAQRMARDAARRTEIMRLRRRGQDPRKQRAMPTPGSRPEPRRIVSTASQEAT